MGSWVMVEDKNTWLDDRQTRRRLAIKEALEEKRG